MSDGGWIVVRNWDKFQHYSDREPVWIKVYLELRDSDEWGDLSYALRGLLVSIWMEYGASRGVLRVSTLAQRTRQSTRNQHLRSLSDAGFIQLSASRPLALARSRKQSREAEEDIKQQSREAAAVDNSSASQPQPFKTLLTRLGVDPALRRRAEAEPERAHACAEAALDRPGITNRGGYFRRLFDSGEWPEESNRQNVEPRDPAKAVKAMIRNGVIHDQVELEAEIAGYRLDQATADELRGLLH